MNYINDTFARMDLSQIINYLLDGVDSYREKTVPYRDAFKKSCDPIYKRLGVLYPNAAERDEA